MSFLFQKNLFFILEIRFNLGQEKFFLANKIYLVEENSFLANKFYLMQFLLFSCCL